MVPLAADENVDDRLLRGLQRRAPDLDIVRVQDAGLAGADDPTILDWAATRERVLLTHDVRTMTAFAAERLEAGQPLPGVIMIPQTEAIGVVIDGILELLTSYDAADLRDRIVYLGL